jgi:hypothetical protein
LNTGALSADCGLAFLGSLKHSAKLAAKQIAVCFQNKKPLCAKHAKRIF